MLFPTLFDGVVAALTFTLTTFVTAAFDGLVILGLVGLVAYVYFCLRLLFSQRSFFW